MRGLRTSAVIAGVAAVALALSACGSKSNGGGNSSAAGSTSAGASSVSSSAATSSSAAAGGGGAALKACMVLDTGGVNDKSFNQSSWDGLVAAKKSNPNLDISYVPSNSSAAYTPNLNAELAKKCDPIIAVGGLMGDNVVKAAKANPNTHFAEVDNAPGAPNMYGLQFNTAQGAFLGGYLAAGMTKTKKVATFGGADIGPVTIYMDGFWEGVQYYNQKNHDNVQVLGWNEKNQKGGTFVPGDNPFGDKNGGQSISQTFITQGADIIFPVAGGSGEGANAAAASSNGKVSVIWVDTDGCISDAANCKYFLTSVTKGLSLSVQAYMKLASTGKFPTGSYIGTLANGGTGLAPYHDFDSKVPAKLKSEVDQVKADITSGKIKITSPSQPHA